MSREDVEVVRTIYDAVNRRDLSAVLDLIAPDIEVRTTVETYRGVDGIATFIEEVDRTFENYTLTVGEAADTGDLIVVGVRQRGRGRASGVDIDHDFTHVWTFHEGRATRLRAFTNRAEALEAVGLRE